MRAVRVHAHGTARAALHYETIEKPRPSAGEVLVKNHYIGVNFIDTYQRSGLYKIPLPATLGREGIGIVEDVGPGVSDVKVGERVCYLSGNSYAEYTAVPVGKALRVPAEVESKAALTLLLQGMTAHYLACSTYPLKDGDTCLVLAAAGGVGQLLVQIAKNRGARVIGTVSTDEKAALVRSLGADEVVVYTKQSVEAEVKRITEGKGVHVAYDSTGKDTWETSLKCLAPLGMLVLFGNASGPVPPLDPLILSEKSLSLCRPSLGPYVATPAALQSRYADLMKWHTAGKLKIQIGAQFALSKAADAHEALESKGTTGKLLLFPDKA